MGEITVDIIRILDKEIARNVKIKEQYNHTIFTEDGDMYFVSLIFNEGGYLEGFIYRNDKKEELEYIIDNFNYFDIPLDIIEYRKANPQVRTMVVTWTKAGGNASQNSISNKITIPNIWLKEMDITELDRKITVVYNGEEIVIKKG